MKAAVIKTMLCIGVALLWFPILGFTGDEQPQADGDQPEIVMEPIVVTATRTEENIERVASSVSVINAEEIEATKDITIKETLRRIPGLDIASQGGLGRQTSVFIRGARSEDTLVMIDGMEINDPITPGRTFNFADLTTANVERIEIIRGPQSTLYGSDAIGGVINIITRTGDGPPQFSLLSEGGSHDTFREVLSGSGRIGKLDYSFSGTRIDSDGISSNDDYEDNAVSSRIGYHLFDRGKLDFVFRSLDAKVHLDDWDFFNFQAINDPNFIQETNSQIYQVRYNHQFAEAWDMTLKVGYFDSKRDDRDSSDIREPNYFAKGWYDASILNVDWQHNWYLGGFDTVTVGFEYEEEKGESHYYYRDQTAWGSMEENSPFPEESVDNKAYYFQNQLRLWDRLFLTGGIRLDDHETFDTETTYKVALAYSHHPTNTKIKGTWGTGFKAPTLYQLFAPAIPAFFFLGGNPHLYPEESESFDIGIEQSFWDDKLHFTAVYFNNKYDDFIAYYTDPATFSSTYVNIEKAETEGWELELRANLFKSLFIAMSYTYTDTQDKTNGGDLLRRPKDKYSIVVDYDHQERIHANLGIHYVGRRVDWRTFTGDAIEGESYTRVDLALNYAVNQYLQVFSKIENLFDEKYQELRGYDAAGISVFGGIKLSF